MLKQVGVIISLLMLLVLPACGAGSGLEGTLKTASEGADSGNPLGKMVDQFLPVKNENRDLRACALGTALVELNTDKVRLGLKKIGTSNELVAGMEAACAIAKSAKGVWFETSMANVALIFAAAGIDIAKTKFFDYASRALSIETVLFGAANLSVDAIKGIGLFNDVKHLLVAVDAGEMSKADAFAAVTDRLNSNKQLLEMISRGVTTLPQ